VGSRRKLECGISGESGVWRRKRKRGLGKSEHIRKTE
jgi:hypothetical protein